MSKIGRGGARCERGVAKEQHWREVHARQVASGLSARAFCRRENLTESAFYFWRRTLRVRDGLSGPPAKSRLTPDKTRSRPTFVPATLRGTGRDEEAITIELASGHVLRLPSWTASTTLVELVVGLETRRPS